MVIGGLFLWPSVVLCHLSWGEVAPDFQCECAVFWCLINNFERYVEK
jgi:hypothetical protein